MRNSRNTDDFFVAGKVGEDVLRDGGEDLVDHGDGLLLVEGEDLGEQVEAVRQRFVRLQLREKRAEPRDARQTARETQKHNQGTCQNAGGAQDGAAIGPFGC